MHWRAHPVSECWKERCATIRAGFGGKEIYVDRDKLKKLGTLRRFHGHVRECMQLQKYVSLRLMFVGCRIFGRLWEEHDVSFSDSVCVPYLTGAIIQAVPLSYHLEINLEGVDAQILIN